MESQHTPGPWSPTGHDGKLSVIVECHWGSVAKVLPIGAIDQERANARLIASAPELLAALEVVLSSTCGNVGDDGYEGCIKIEAKALDRARAAIAKAKGV